MAVVRAVRTSLTEVTSVICGLHLVPGWGPLAQQSWTPAVSQYLRLHPGWCRETRRSLRVSPTSSLCSSRTDPQRSPQPQGTAGGRTGGPEEEEREGPEYIPRRRKRKNPLMKIGYAWMIGLPTGIIGFILAKRQVDQNRLKQLKVRQRMKRSTEGEYEGNRYRPPAEVKLDR